MSASGDCPQCGAKDSLLLVELCGESRWRCVECYEYFTEEELWILKSKEAK